MPLYVGAGNGPSAAAMSVKCPTRAQSENFRRAASFPEFYPHHGRAIETQVAKVGK